MPREKLGTRFFGWNARRSEKPAPKDERGTASNQREPTPRRGTRVSSTCIDICDAAVRDMFESRLQTPTSHPATFRGSAKHYTWDSPVQADMLPPATISSSVTTIAPIISQTGEFPARSRFQRVHSRRDNHRALVPPRGTSRPSLSSAQWVTARGGFFSCTA